MPHMLLLTSCNSDWKIFRQMIECGEPCGFDCVNLTFCWGLLPLECADCYDCNRCGLSCPDADQLISRDKHFSRQPQPVLYGTHCFSHACLDAMRTHKHHAHSHFSPHPANIAAEVGAHARCSIALSTHLMMSRSPVSIAPSAPAAIDVLIVGGGLCGLAVAISVALSGHRATVYEAFETTHPFGSGLYIPPNGTRLLSRWGLNDILKPFLTATQSSQIYNFDGGLLAGWGDNYDEEILRRYQFPLWTLHRVDLQRGLTRRALDLGVKIHYSSRITDIDGFKPTITFENGEKRRGDLVVVADGTWSTLRGKVLEQDITPQRAGYTAYRITVGRGQVQDKDLLDLMSSTQSRRWVGQGSYALCFPVRGGLQLSALLILPTAISSGSSSTSAVIEELKKLAENWDPL